MSENSNKNQQYPFMYIVQPEITVPESDMQEQLRVKIESSDQELEVVEVNGISDEIRIVSTESLKDALKNKVAEVNMSEIRVKEEEVIVLERNHLEKQREMMEKEMETETETETVKVIEGPISTEGAKEVQVVTASLEETGIELNEAEQEMIGGLSTSVGNIETNHDEVIVEMSTSVSVESVQQEVQVKTDSLDDSSKKVKKVIRKKKFSEMTKEEVVITLAKIPPAVPKPFCNITIKGKKLRGQIQRRKGDTYYLKTLQSRNNEVIMFKLSEVDHIEVENL